MTEDLRATMKAGSNSNQTINVGLSVAEVHTIVADRISKEFGDFKENSIDVLHARLREFENSLVSRLVRAGKLDSAGDPNLWVAIQAAAVQAAGSDGDEDIEFLVDLLVERVEEPADRRRRTVIDGAIKVISSLDAETLAGISTLYAVTELNPTFSRPGLHLEMMDRLVAKLNPAGLPRSNEWTEHAINIGAASSVVGLRPFRDFLNARFAWCLSPGVEEDTEEYQAAIAVSLKVGSPGLALGHPYRPGFMVTHWSESQQLVTYMTGHGVEHEDAVRIADEMKTAWHIGTVHPEPIRQFSAELEPLNHLKLFSAWWSNLTPPIVLTSVGKMVGLINIKRIAPAYTRKNVIIVG